MDFESIAALNNGLKPIELTVKALSREDVILVQQKKRLISLLRRWKSRVIICISQTLLEKIQTRIEQRLDKSVMSLLNCLHPNFSISSKKDLKFAEKLLNRLFLNDENANIVNETPESEEAMSLSQELQNHLDSAPQKVIEGVKQTKDFDTLKKTGRRSANLEKLFNALLTIKPTLTDVGRVFSSTYYFCNKIRSSLSDKSLNALVFLNITSKLFLYRHSSLVHNY